MSISRWSTQRQRMPRLMEAKSAEDDWTGVTNAAARRKRQNRLNVRAHRKRKATSASTRYYSSGSATTSSALSRPYWVGHARAVMQLPSPTACTHNTNPLLPMDIPAASSISNIIFPLSCDHLITLLQFNVLRGCLLNRQLLDQVPGHNSHLHSAFAPTDLHIFAVASITELSHLPPSLHPTLIQSTTPHPHWIDIIPHPVFRDNLIKALDIFEPYQLWSDTVGGLFEGFPDDEAKERGVVMWEMPWCWEGWELSEGFVRRWAWALRGCGDMLAATDRWREKRGEERLAKGL